VKLDGDRYQLQEEIGHGTFAKVYRALDTRLDRVCAIKVLHEGSSSETRQRFVAEIKALGRLEHPHILRVFAAGTSSNQGFVVTELAEGGTLLDLVRRDGPLAVDATLGWMVQTLSALAHAHARAVVHRDVKPSNIMLDGEGRVRLGDFGIAMQMAADIQRLTRTGTPLGTTIYMAPEQRADARSVGPKADLYSIGTSIYRLVVGLNPQELYAAPPSSQRWTCLPYRLQPLLRKALAPQPSDRFADAADMARALLEAMSAEAREATLALPGCDPDAFPTPSPRFELESLGPSPTVVPTLSTDAVPVATPTPPDPPEAQPEASGTPTNKLLVVAVVVLLLISVVEMILLVTR